MPRTNGSKNKPVPTLDEQIIQVTAEIESLQAKVTEKQDELKRLNKLKEEETLKLLMEAILASGKTVDEIMAMMKQI